MGNSAAQFAGLLAGRHRVTVFTPLYESVAAEATTGYPVERLASPLRFGNAAWLPQLIWRLRRSDIVHLHYPCYGAHLAVLLACMVWRKKLVLHYHMDALATGPKGWLFCWNRFTLLPLLLRRADAVIGASLDYLSHSQIARYYRRHAEKFREIPFWVDGERFRPPQVSEAGETGVLFVGGLDRAHYFKGLEVLLTAMKDVVANCAGGVCLRVVGSGDLLSHYRELAAGLGIARRVHFLGNLDDAALERAYREASFLVLPSINQGEAFGLVLLEAMASGKPVIASDLPGVRRVFGKGEGLVAKVGDAQDLARKMLTLANDRDLRERMGRNARALVCRKYLEKGVALGLDGLYQQLRAQ